MKAGIGSVNLLLLTGLVLLLVTGAGLLALLDPATAEPILLAVLGLLAVIGIAALFAFASGIARFGTEAPAAAPAITEPLPLGTDLIDTQPEAVLVTEPDGRPLYGNPSFLSLSDSGNELRSIDRLFAGDPSASEAVFRIARRLREGGAGEQVVRLPRSGTGPEAAARWLRIAGRPASAAQRPVWVWTIADVTHERREQEAGFQQLQQVVTFLDHAPAGFFASDATGAIRYFNATLAEWLGYDLAELDLSRLTLATLVPGDGAELLQALTGSPGEVRTEFVDIDLKRRNGTRLPARLIHRTTFALNGRPGDSRTLVLNRSPGEDASEAVRAAEVRFARFFNNTPIAIAALDRQGRVGRTNAAFARLFGAGAAAGHPIEGAVAEADRSRLLEAIAAACAEAGETAHVDVSLSGNPKRSVRFYLSGVTDGSGTDDEAAIAYVLETTEQRALEEQFAQSQKMQAIGELAGGIAHEFRNVLQGIVGFSDLLLQSHRPSDPSYADIQQISQNAARATSVVEQLLAYSRQQTLRPRKLALNDVIADLSITLGRLIGERVELKSVYGRDLWPVMADPTQFTQVVMNLAVNARDAMPDGGKLTIRTSNLPAAEARARFAERGVPDQDFVLIDVADTGKGIPPEVMAKIFEPFFTTKEVGKGTGLGLSTVDGIIRQTGGFILPESTLGVGTTFHILLPRHREDQAAEPAPRRSPVEIAAGRAPELPPRTTPAPAHQRPAAGPSPVRAVPPAARATPETPDADISRPAASDGARTPLPTPEETGTLMRRIAHAVQAGEVDPPVPVVAAPPARESAPPAPPRVPMPPPLPPRTPAATGATPPPVPETARPVADKPPAAEPAPPAPRAAETEPAAPARSLDLTGTASILLVEDEEAVRAFATRALESRGYTVYKAGTGNEALELMRDHRDTISLVVSDVVMPEMDGPTLLKELRKIRPGLPIIFVSGYAKEAFARNMPDGETFGFLAKPFTLRQLATTVKETLAGA